MSGGDGVEEGGGKESCNEGRDKNSRRFANDCSKIFRDMQAERDELAKRIFPQLGKLCESRGVTWGGLDLRWGITDEQKAEGKVLPICLAEIHNCRPYFIGLRDYRDRLAKDRGKLAKKPEQVQEDIWRKREDGTPLAKASTSTNYADGKRAFGKHGGQLNPDPPERHRHER